MDDKNNSQDPQPYQPGQTSDSPDRPQSSDAFESNDSYVDPIENTSQPNESDANRETDSRQQSENVDMANDPYEPKESTVPIVQPLGQQPQQSPVPEVTPAKPNKKRRLIVIISALVLLLLAAAAAAYFFWYQNPNKVVSDGIMNAIQAKTITYTGSLTTTGDAKVKIDFTGENASDSGKLGANVTFDFENESYTLGADVLVDSKKDFYFKVKNIDSLVENYRGTVPTESQALFDQIIAKVNDKWIKISAEDLKNYSADAAQAQTCMTDAAKKIQEDQQVKNQLTDLYKKHPFIVIDEELGSKDGSLGYKLVPNDEQSIAFTKGLRETDVYKSLQKCDPTFTIKDEDLKSSDDKSEPVELWVDRWSHNITKFTASDEEDGTKADIIFEPEFNQNVSIETPKDATTLQQLQADVEALVMSAMMASQES